MNNPFVIILFILGGCIIAWYLVRPRPSLRLVVSQAKIVSQNGLKRSQISQAEEFFEKEFPDTQSIKIAAFPGPYGRLRFQIKGDLDVGEIQQIRNFLVDIT